MTPRFTQDTLRFLRALKRHNRREWFQPRKDQYDEHVRGPMLALIERLAVDFGKLAPEIIASLEASIRLPARPGRRCVPRTPGVQMKNCASPYQSCVVSS